MACRASLPMSRPPAQYVPYHISSSSWLRVLSALAATLGLLMRREELPRPGDLPALPGIPRIPGFVVTAQQQDDLAAGGAEEHPQHDLLSLGCRLGGDAFDFALHLGCRPAQPELIQAAAERLPELGLHDCRIMRPGSTGPMPSPDCWPLSRNRGLGADRIHRPARYPGDDPRDPQGPGQRPGHACRLSQSGMAAARSLIIVRLL